MYIVRRGVGPSLYIAVRATRISFSGVRVCSRWRARVSDRVFAVAPGVHVIGELCFDFVGAGVPRIHTSSVGLCEGADFSVPASLMTFSRGRLNLLSCGQQRMREGQMSLPSRPRKPDVWLKRSEQVHDDLW